MKKCFYWLAIVFLFNYAFSMNKTGFGCDTRERLTKYLNVYEREFSIYVESDIDKPGIVAKFNQFVKTNGFVEMLCGECHFLSKMNILGQCCQFILGNFTYFDHDSIKIFVAAYLIADLILRCRIDPEATIENCWTMVHVAAASKTHYLLRVFLEMGLNPSCKAGSVLWGITPLHVAGTQPDGLTVKILLEYGANPQIPDCCGRFPW